jgi:hypothetical protein
MYKDEEAVASAQTYTIPFSGTSVTSNVLSPVLAKFDGKWNSFLVYLKDLFDKDENLKRVLLVQPESIGDIFLVTSLFESLRNRYPSDKYKIYIATKPEYREIIEGNPFIDKWIPYHQLMDSAILMEGGMNQKTICDIVYHPYFSTQRLLSYMHNGEDKIDLNLK